MANEYGVVKGIARGQFLAEIPSQKKSREGGGRVRKRACEAEDARFAGHAGKTECFVDDILVSGQPRSRRNFAGEVFTRSCLSSWPRSASCLVGEPSITWRTELSPDTSSGRASMVLWPSSLSRSRSIVRIGRGVFLDLSSLLLPLAKRATEMAHGTAAMGQHCPRLGKARVGNGEARGARRTREREHRNMTESRKPLSSISAGVGEQMRLGFA